ncbi:MAG: hypothetical protein WBO29_11295 [Albidovulum sp.]
MDERWLAVLSRITPQQPIDLETVLLGAKKATVSKPDREFLSAIPPAPAPSATLWSRTESDLSYLGVRLTTPLADSAQTAIRLASAALERGITPIILTTLSNSGFERFGFRVERIMGESDEERAACEEELKRFWNMAIVVDAAEVALLG